jgi:general secretion pathway protein M
VNTAALSEPAAALRERLQAQWKALPAQQRRIMSLSMAVLGCLLLWFVAISPALKVVRAAPAQLERLDTQLQSMQRDAAEARSLRSITPIGAAQSALALRSATDALGEVGKLVVAGDRATLTLTGASPQQMRDWLADARSTGRARVVEVSLTQPTGSATLNGTIVVSLPGAGS